MKLKNKYLISLDLDGTLLKDNKKICFNTKKYIKKLVKQGNFIVLNSGRPYRALIGYYNQLKIKTPAICYNGSLIIYPDNVNLQPHKKPFDQKYLLKVLKRIPNGYVKCIMCETEEEIWLTNDICFKFLYYNKDNKMKIHYGDLTKTLNNDTYTCIFEMANNNPETKEFFSHLCDDNPNYAIRFWASGFFCEIAHSDINKAEALKLVAKDLNISPDNIYTFGDSDNDVELITAFKHGVAMINGAPEIKEIAPFVTDYDNNHNGIMKFLKKHLK